MKIKKVYISIFLILSVIFAFSSINYIFANSNDENNINLDLKVKIKDIFESDSGNIDVTKIIKEYENLSKEYTDDQIADALNDIAKSESGNSQINTMINNANIEEAIGENKQNLNKNGISGEDLSKGIQTLKTMDTEELNKILNEDLNIKDVKEKLDEGYSATQIIKDVSNKLTTKEKINVAIKLVLANKIFKMSVTIYFILLIYSIIIRWIIFKKAGKHGFAAIIPIYRDIVYFKVCGISPWVILLYLIPFIGWFIIGVLYIVSRFELSYNFGKKTGFGFGLWIFPVIFESIIAFSKKIKYVE